jgi:DNA mismatch repair protein MutL
MDLSNVIKLLPDSVANQIAAGEVVQRPASVVKELLENSIDAGSTEIKLIVKNSGKTLIQVIDNGSGMTEIDARMCFERHATSKLRSSDDLFRIRTMGFRGEALASVAAVAQVELTSAIDDGGMGTYIDIEGSVIKEQNYTTAQKGTKISVKNLFFNVPARRNFLKSNVVELKHIVDEFQKVALSRPDIAFSFYNDDLDIYHLLVGKLSHRIVNIFGKNYKEQLIYCNEETDLIKLKGYIGKPENAKKTRGEQFFFVNNRFIKSPYLYHAVKNAFQGLIPLEGFPFYVIFIEVDPSKIDINIHPTKTEVKFQEDKLVYAVLQSAIKRALADHHIIPSLDFERNVNSDMFEISAPTKYVNQSSYTNHTYDNVGTRGTNIRYEDIFPQHNTAGKSHSSNDFATRQMEMLEILEDSNVNETDSRNMQVSGNKIQIGNKYIMIPLKSSIAIINQSAAHERVIYEKVLRCLTDIESIDSQQLLFHYELELTGVDYMLLREHEEDIKALGFSLEFKSDNSISIKGYPTYILESACIEIIETVIGQVKLREATTYLGDYNHNLAQSIARKACVKPGKLLDKREIDTIVDSLFSCDNPNYTADGKRIFKLLYAKDIEEIIG